MSFRTIFITGTDTGVGKTVVTALLLRYLRQNGCHALAIKPFCTGGRTDAEILRAVQYGELSLQQINPFYFPEPVAPCHVPLGRTTRVPLRASRFEPRTSDFGLPIGRPFRCFKSRPAARTTCAIGRPSPPLAWPKGFGAAYPPASRQETETRTRP